MKSAAKTIALVLLSGAVFFNGCSLIDEDLSVCDTSLSVDYQLRLVTNMQTELATQLSLQTDLILTTSLKTHLSGVFTDYARDVDLSFYDTVDPGAVLEHMSEEMDDSQSSYTLYIPVRDYMHLSVANIAGSGPVSLEGADFCSTAKLVQHCSEDGTVESHKTGIFTARKRMNILSGVDQRFDVRLYMANAATALVLDSEEALRVKDLRVEVSGFAESFSIADSTYTFAENTDARILTERLEPEGTGELCFVSVNFPSRELPETNESPETKVIIDTDEIAVSPDADNPLWYWTVYATLEDGSVTMSNLGVLTPLRAGQFKLVKAKLHDSGIVSTSDPMVGVSVTLDWQGGTDQNVDL